VSLSRRYSHLNFCHTKGGEIHKETQKSVVSSPPSFVPTDTEETVTRTRPVSPPPPQFNTPTLMETVYYETITRESKIKPNSECRSDERLKTKVEESTRLSDTGLFGELEHLEIKTRLIDEKFTSVMCECVTLLIRKEEENRSFI
jgi:hypothetical protein